MTLEGARDVLRGVIVKHGDQRAAAQVLGVSPANVSDMMCGGIPGPKILRALGLRRVTGYELIAAPKRGPRRSRKD